MKNNPLSLPVVLASSLGLALAAASLSAQTLAISIGIRETGGSGPAFSNGGVTGSLEWVNLDGQFLTLDGTWQQFTFTPSTDTLSAFTGNGALDGNWVVLEHIRITNTSGITAPITMWLDDFTNTTLSGSTTEGFESFSAGSEVMFQEPSFSGSTDTNVAAGSSSLLTDSFAHSGTLSNEINFQFVDGDTTRWIRLTTNGLTNLPNPLFLAAEEGGSPTFSFYAAAIPEPSTYAAIFGGLALLGAFVYRRRARATK